MDVCINHSVLREYDSDVRRYVHRTRFDNMGSFRRLVTSLGEGYRYDDLERCILVHTTRSGESIYIRFPGRGTIQGTSNALDFKPVVVQPDGVVLPDLSMSDIWMGFENMVSGCDACIRVLGHSLYNMFTFTDHKKRTIGEIMVDVPVPPENPSPAVNVDVWIYSPEGLINDIMDSVDDVSRKVLGMSMEAFLVYLDLMCQSDDCRYNIGGFSDSMDYRRGRPNALKTHMAVLGTLAGVMPLGNLLHLFTVGRGVARISDTDMYDIAVNLMSL